MDQNQQQFHTYYPPTKLSAMSFRYGGDVLNLVSARHPTIVALANRYMATEFADKPETCYALVANVNFTCAACDSVCAFVVASNPEWDEKDAHHRKTVRDLVAKARASDDPKLCIPVKGRYLLAAVQCHRCITKTFFGRCHLTVERFSGVEMTQDAHKELMKNLITVSEFMAQLSATNANREPDANGLDTAGRALAAVNQIVDCARVKGAEAHTQREPGSRVPDMFRHLGDWFCRPSGSGSGSRR
ncbi:uncharacterized protein LOC62_01G000093 [Vanrija pseudolonga]|uniref:Uncharacterized protein n=1 Tax=Vanrija pseudolonga TaxID=143232 RepID=A0AAF0XZU4_9TREE|nr:hypothetical protein LOC62_01G000093 [Vanrija pseudolonga]